MWPGEWPGVQIASTAQPGIGTRAPSFSAWSAGTPWLGGRTEPRGWARIQESIAGLSGISLLLVEGQQPPALIITNNNSICAALQSSPKYGKLCDPFCGAAHERAIGADTVTHYRCHAGLHCFAMPVELDSRRKLAVIGGRALASSADYRELAERFRSGDLQTRE